MEALVLQNNAYDLSLAGNMIINKIAQVYKENSALIICGLMGINGFSNTYKTYELLNK